MIPNHEASISADAICDRVIYNNKQILIQIKRIAQELYDYYWGCQVFHIHTITMLNGATRFATTLMDEFQKIVQSYPDRNPIVLHEDTVLIGSYGTGFTSNADPKLIAGTQFNTKGRYVLILEDIIETGLTLSFYLHLLSFGSKIPEDIKIATLIDKPHERKAYKINGRKRKIYPDFVGFKLKKPYFLVGFGLDYKHYFRNLDYIMSVKKDYQK